MTTKVVVETHAGWPVRVTSLLSDGSQTVDVVPAHKIAEFYVHDGKDLRIHEVQPDTGLTFGERAVGKSFNPSQDPLVDRLKALYAEIISIADVRRRESGFPEAKRHWSIAITDAETAQMRAVKAATWK